MIMINPEEISIQTINHLGLIAGIIDDIEIEKIINEIVGFDNRELVTAGQVVKAIILNGLGFVSKPLYLFPLEKSQLSSDDILIKYQEQQAPERGFAFLKDPLFFADSVFLKSPQRVETMAMLMGLCL